jgi:hypothetical protein
MPTRQLAEPPHVVDLTTGIVDVSQHQDGDATVDGVLDLGTLDDAQGVVAFQ